MSFAHFAALMGSVVLTLSAHAGQTCVTVTVPLTTTNWTQSLSIPRFGSNYGVLTAVHVQLGAHIQGSCGVENAQPLAEQIALEYSAQFTLTRPDNTLVLLARPTQNIMVSLSGYDGTLDFAGTSGALFPGLSVDVVPAPAVTLSSASDLALFTGPSGNPGTFNLNLQAAGTSSATGSGPIIVTFATQASAVVTICYDYDPAVTSFCSGTNSACPCMNGSFFGGGCKNSANLGALLSHSGVASASADTLVLNATELPAGTSVLFFQGTARVNGGAGSIFGDGLVCAGGTVTRLGVKLAPAGSASFPALGDTQISIAGSNSPGVLRTYQAWYRDAASFCTSETFNLTQGLEARWLP
ncbi:MAG: choice-of-anchor E domain-containing protein [Planctomycetes bacterium]|nr:choice-of-anchor E domain-containing protein [Planctomycetota bacterium]